MILLVLYWCVRGSCISDESCSSFLLVYVSYHSVWIYPYLEKRPKVRFEVVLPVVIDWGHSSVWMVECSQPLVLMKAECRHSIWKFAKVSFHVSSF